MNARTLSALALCCLAWASTESRASEPVFGLHVASVHAPAKPHQNNSNAGLYACKDQWCAGGYHNTYNRTTLYALRAFELGYGFDFRAGVASGYKRECTSEIKVVGYEVKSYEHKGGTATTKTPILVRNETCTGFSRGYLTPMAGVTWLAPVKFVNLQPRVWFAPGFGKHSSVVHASLEASF